MAQDYEVLSFKAGDFKDQNNNYWCEMALKGVSEPVRIAVRDPQQFKEGMELYGNIIDATSKAGKPYLRFKRESREEQQSFNGKTHEKREWQPRDDNAQESIARSVALKAAVELTASDERLMKDKATVLDIADRFLEWLQRGSEQPIQLLESNPNTERKVSGYDKFKASKPQPKTEDHSDPEFASMLAKGMEADGIDMSEIPF